MNRAGSKIRAPGKFVSSSLNHEGVHYPRPIEVVKAERMEKIPPRLAK